MNWKENKFGILSIVFGVLPFLYFVLSIAGAGGGGGAVLLNPTAWVALPIIGLLLGIVSLKREKKKSNPKFGIAISVIAILLFIAIQVLYQLVPPY